MSDPDIGQVLFELRRVGNTVKVSAVHVASNTEVCTLGSPTAGEHALKMAALRKLIWVMGKRRDAAKT